MTTSRRRRGRHRAPVTVSDRLLTGAHQLAFLIIRIVAHELVHDTVPTYWRDSRTNDTRPPISNDSTDKIHQKPHTSCTPATSDRYHDKERGWAAPYCQAAGRRSRPRGWVVGPVRAGCREVFGCR